MIEYVNGPCSWSRIAPKQLRLQVCKGTLSWENYSTRHILDGSGLSVASENGIFVLKNSLNLQLEILPGRLSERWRKIGLHFASYTEIRDVNFAEVLEHSLDLISRVDPILGTVSELCRSIHVLKSSESGFDSSYSDPTLPFSIFVSCPLAPEKSRIERLTESIVHEALHLQLSLVERLEPLINRNCEANVAYSPWKEEWRSLHGLLHSIYVFGNLRFFWRSIATQHPSNSSFAKARVNRISDELASLGDLASNAALTPMGRKLAMSLLEGH